MSILIKGMEMPTDLVDRVNALPSADASLMQDRCKIDASSDLISRQAAIDALEEHLDYLQTLNKDENPTAESKWYGVNWARNTIADLSSAQPERNKGEWIPFQLSTGETYSQCSCCRRNAPMVETGCLMNRHLEALLTDFCPYCGADMRGEK